MSSMQHKFQPLSAANICFPEGKKVKFPHSLITTSYIQFLDRENNDKNNTLPLGKQICYTIVWGCAEILPEKTTQVAWHTPRT